MITLTESATTKVDELIKEEGEDDLALRVAVRPGGCSGFSYEMYFDSDILTMMKQQVLVRSALWLIPLVQCFYKGRH